MFAGCGIYLREVRMRVAALPGWSATLRTVSGLACLLSALGCSSSETFVAPARSRCAVEAETSTSAFSPGGGSGTVQITTNRECAWSVQSDAAWLTLQPEPSGNGDGSVQFKVAANADPSSRTAGLSVNSERLPISQEGEPCEFELSSTHQALDASGGQRIIDVQTSSSQCSWSATADVTWISLVQGRTGSGNGRVVFDVGPAPGSSRTGTLTIAGQSVQVVQGIACTYATGVTAVAVGPAGGPAKVPVIAPPGCSWRAQSQVGWVAVSSGSEGTGPGVVELSVAPTSGANRAGTVIVAGVIVTVTQSSGCDITVDPPAHAATVAGGTGSVTVRADPGCSWSAGSTASWIAITSGTTGSGDGQVLFAVAANSGPARSGSLTIGGRIVSISQPSGCTFSLTPTAVDLSPASQTVPLSLSTAAGCLWNAVSEAAWFSLSQSSGSGPVQLSLTVAANNGPRRSDSLSVAGQTLTVSQASPCTWVLAPPSPHDFDADGGRGSLLVIVDGPCTWTAASTVSWIAMETGLSGTGEGLVQFIVAPNAGPARSGVVRIAAIDYLIRQAGR
jgi:hypothetical protein